MTGIEAEPAVVIVVRGTPAPQGSKNGFINKHTGRVQLVESSKKVAPWREAVRGLAFAEVACTCPDMTCTKMREGFPIDEPVVVSMVFTMPKPASAPKTRRTWPERYPDLSKLARSTEDSLTDVGVIKDDARIVEYDRLAKVFPNEDPDALAVPGVIVRVWRLHDVLTWRTAVAIPAAAPSLFDQAVQL